MMRIIPKEEVEFGERVNRLVRSFAVDEGISFTAVTDSRDVQRGIDIITDALWFIKNNVKQSDFDKKNMKRRERSETQTKK